MKYKIHLKKLMQELVGTCRNFEMKSSTTMAQSFPCTLQKMKHLICHHVNLKP